MTSLSFFIDKVSILLYLQTRPQNRMLGKWPNVLMSLKSLLLCELLISEMPTLDFYYEVIYFVYLLLLVHFFL